MDVALPKVVQHLRRPIAVYLGLDPGIQKFGWAFLIEENLLCSGISKTTCIGLFMEKVKKSHWGYLDDSVLEGKLESLAGKTVDQVFLGNGTGGNLFRSSLSEDFPEVVVVDERNSTLDARSIYWNLHPPRGWRRVLPLSLQTPPRPVDDLAAYGIALKGMRFKKEKEI